MISPNYKKALTLFSGKVKMLILDDDAALCKSLSGIFASPLFKITTATTLTQANNLIKNSHDPWHCWIVDIDLGNGQSGLDMFKQTPVFPYGVVLSGLRSMSIASEAMKTGVWMVFDKNPVFFNKIYDEVCKIAAIGYILNGRRTPHVDVFSHLQDNTVTDTEKWAKKACMARRNLQRICELHDPLSPRYALTLYRTIYYLLWNIPGSQAGEQDLQSGFGPDPAQQELYESSIEYILKKTDK